jgi:ligand-binding sensor domain-containing protein
VSAAGDARGDTLWVGTRQGLYRIQDNVAEQVRQEAIAAVTVDASGAPWVCTSQGIVYRGPEWQRVTDTAQMIGSAAGASVRSLAVQSDGTVWLATANGLAMLAPDGATALYTEKDELLSRDVRALVMGPDDALWVATAGGLARHMANGRWTRFTVDSTEGGLRSKDLRALHLDAAGNLWIATVAGVSFRTPETDWFYYDLPTAQCLLPTGGDDYWVGTRGGLYRVQRSLFTAVP